MATPGQLIAALEREIGTTERPAGSNRNKYAAIAGHANGYPWCATFVVAMAKQVGVEGVPNTAYTPTMAAGFSQAGRVVAWQSAQPGDVVLFDFAGGRARIEHVGWVARREGDHLVCIEGNTSASGSQSNGGAVLRKRRHIPSMRRVVVGRPAWGPVVDPLTLPDGDGILRRGDINGDVVTWQKALNQITNAGLQVSGEFEAATEAATRAFQQAHGLLVDGEAGPITLGKMEELQHQAEAPKDEPELVEAIRYASEAPVDAWIAKMFGAPFPLSVATLDDRRSIGKVHLVGKGAVDGFDRQLAREIVEHAGASRLETFDSVAQLLREHIASL